MVFRKVQNSVTSDSCLASKSKVFGDGKVDLKRKKLLASISPGAYVKNNFSVAEIKHSDWLLQVPWVVFKFVDDIYPSIDGIISTSRNVSHSRMVNVHADTKEGIPFYKYMVVGLNALFMWEK